ncbi:MAG: hypothetical protein NVS9B15_23410 [Acidobacteriaceae bacterium]
MVNKAKAASDKDGREFLRTSFKDVQHVLSAHLDLSARSISHDGVMGAVNEQHWIQLLRQYLPNRYACDTGIVIDSRGHMSDQIDIVIYDPQYTPTLLTQQSHRYIPAEAVYGVFEAKPTINRELLLYAGRKAASVRKLHRTSVSISHAGGTFPPRPLFPIVAGIVASKVDWADGFGKSFGETLNELAGEATLDCGCGLADGSFDRFAADANITIGSKDGALIFFLFRLLGKLQSLGTVPAIDWTAYVSIFNSAA